MTDSLYENGYYVYVGYPGVDGSCRYSATVDGMLFEHRVAGAWVNDMANCIITDADGDEAQVDSIVSALRTINVEHAEIHAEDHYFCSASDASVAIAAPKTWRITTPNTSTRIHLTFHVVATDGGLVELLENPTLNAAGSALNEYNNDRNSSNTATATCFEDTTTLADGTVLLSEYIGNDTNPANAEGGILDRHQELILKQNEDYIVRFTPFNNNTEASILMEWYEE